MAYLLEVDDLHTFFKTKKGIVKAVNGVSYRVEPGKTLGIVGESGSGKSVSAMSILKLLDGNGYIDSGTITFKGRNLAECTINDMYQIRGNEISVIFQEPMTSLNPVYTIEKQLNEVYLTHQKITKKEASEKSLEMLKAVKIPNPESVMKQFPHQLSGGMRQRVMIAMALACEPNYADLLVLGNTPENAPDEDEYVTMTFEEGVPKTINGEAMKVSDIIRKLNELGGKHGIGIVDIVENRVVGMKSRGVYETPGGTILMEAHKQLEELVIDRATMEVKKDLGNKLAQVVYEGKWFTPLCEALRAFVKSTQKYVTGEVKFRLYKGNIIKAGTTSPYSLYNESLASFTTGDMYDHHDASGFITLFGLPLKVRAMKNLEVNNK